MAATGEVSMAAVIMHATAEGVRIQVWPCPLGMVP
jgi:hypothetical protein